MVNADKRKNKLPLLIRKIKSIDFSRSINESNLIDISKSVLNEWKIINKRYNFINSPNLKLMKKRLIKYKAEEEIVIGLLFYLNNKIINYIVNNE